MNPSRAESLSLVGGSLALDFANTASGRATGAPSEHLLEAEHVVGWAAHAGAVAEGAAPPLRAELARDPRLAQTFLGAAVTLRDTIYRIGAALAGGSSPPAGDLQALRDIAKQAMGDATLVPTPNGRYSFDFSAAPPASALLGPVAWSAIELLERGHFERLKQCPGPDCGWLFYDSSKNNSRRWCDMASCGNRSKAQRHRARR